MLKMLCFRKVLMPVVMLAALKLNFLGHRYGDQDLHKMSSLYPPYPQAPVLAVLFLVRDSGGYSSLIIRHPDRL
jgi:hypothetical protein